MLLFEYFIIPKGLINNIIKFHIYLYIRLLITFIFLLFTSIIQAQAEELTGLHKALVTSETDTSKISAYIRMSAYQGNQNVDSCLIYSKKAYDLSKKNKNYKFLEASKWLVWSYSLSSNYEKSLKYSMIAYNYAKRNNDTRYTAAILGSIGSDYLMLNNYQMALKYLNQSLNESDEYRSKLSALVNIAQVYAGTERYPEAHDNYTLALSMAEKANNKKDIAIIYNRIGNLYLMEEAYDTSLRYYEKSISMLDTNELYYLVTGLRGVVENHIVSERYEKGLKIAKMADSLARKGGFLSEMKFINQFTSELYDSLRNYPKSLHYYKIYTTIKDSIFNLEKYKRIEQMQTDFEIEQKELQVEILEKEAILNKKFNIIYLIICLLAIFILVYFVKNIRQKNKLLTIESEKDSLENQTIGFQLDEKNEEVLIHSMQIHQQKEVLTSIKTKLSDILELKEPKKIKESIRHLNDEIQVSINVNDEWDQIKLHFEKVYPHFFEKLGAEFPELTTAELKLCVYTKLKFGNKEISRLLNINSASVHIARYRLKKKMRLPENENLDEFIMTRV